MKVNKFNRNSLRTSAFPIPYKFPNSGKTPEDFSYESINKKFIETVITDVDPEKIYQSKYLNIMLILLPFLSVKSSVKALKMPIA